MSLNMLAILGKYGMLTLQLLGDLGEPAARV